MSDVSGAADAAAGTAKIVDTGASTAPVDVSRGGASPTQPPAGGAGDNAAQATAGDQKTILNGGGDEGEKPVAVQANWPEDWRDKLAAEVAPGDSAFRKRLDRFSSPANVARSWRSLELKQSSGELRAVTPFPEKGTEEEKAAWRQLQGVPLKPEDYKVELPKGVVLGEADKPVVEDFTKFVHGKHWTPAQVNEGLAWYHDYQERQQAQRAEADAAFRQEAEDALRAEFGNNYRPTINGIKNLLSTAPEGFADRLLGGRTADGKLIGDDPAALKWLAGLSREINPVATILPAGTGAEGFKTRLEQLEALVKDVNSEYYTGQNGPALREEYRKLLEAQEKMQARGRAAA